MMSNRKRLSTKKHGTLVTLANIDHNITSLIAKWAFKILSNTTLPSYSSLWYYEIHHMSTHLGYKCPDHFLNSTNLHTQALSRAKPHQLKFNLFTLSCMLSYKEMGHTRIISPTWEDIVDQPLFDNRHINQPNTHKPWHKPKSPFHKCSKLKFVHNLLDGFDIDEYSSDPSIPTARFKTIGQLQQQFPNLLLLAADQAAIAMLLLHSPTTPAC